MLSHWLSPCQKEKACQQKGLISSQKPSIRKTVMRCRRWWDSRPTTCNLTLKRLEDALGSKMPMLSQPHRLPAETVQIKTQFFNTSLIVLRRHSHIHCKHAVADSLVEKFFRYS